MNMSSTLNKVETKQTNKQDFTKLSGEKLPRSPFSKVAGWK